MPISDEIKQKEIKLNEQENKGFRINIHKNMLYIGIGVFLLGLFLLGSSLFSILFTNQGRFFLWSPFITLIGLGQIIYGLYGIYQEKKSN